MTVRVGCSGWSYKDWRGPVYPDRAPQREWFSLYSAMFCTVELNNTFYRLPPSETFSGWATEAPRGFVFSVKLNRYGTHRRRLREPEAWLKNHLSGVALLGRSLGPQLVQLPPRWRCDLARLEEFCQCARRLETAYGEGAPLRWAVEVRDASWLNDGTFALLEKYDFALCLHDLLERHPWQLTTGWAYARFHGPDAIASKYNGEYGAEGLRGAARRLRTWADEGMDIYAYFNNDMGGAAVRDARWLAQALVG